ncbi:hypothetical protein DFH06DRAFT_1318186 [Mycena polygramma]|nr:hypothetical protein DFH06DRAFT_1318186 [Mycena polygramma]
MSPLMCICLPGRVSWPERFKRTDYSEDIERPLAGLPFLFYDIDWSYEEGQWDPTKLENNAVTFSPDLPGQTLKDVDTVSGSGDEPDSQMGLGCCGDWVTALVDKRDRGQPLGRRTRIVWNMNGTWGAEVRLEALKVVEPVDKEEPASDEEDGEEDTDGPSRRSISAYDIRDGPPSQPDEIEEESQNWEEAENEDVEWY